MLDLSEVNWYQDKLTLRFVEEHGAELADPLSMVPACLAGAATYCQDITNPYAEELARRAGLLEKYLHTSGAERTEIVRRAAKGFNILLV